MAEDVVLAKSLHETKTRRKVVTGRTWHRLSRQRAAVAGSTFLLAMTLVTLIALPFSTSWYTVQDIERAVRAEPTLEELVPYDLVRGTLQKNAWASPFAFAGRTAHRASGWMGYDAVGRSLFYRCMLGWLVSMLIGLSAATLSLTIGVLWGSMAALAGGVVDTIMMRIVEVLYGLPYILLVILMQVGLYEPLRGWLGREGQMANLVVLTLAIGSVSWLTMARVIRGQVLSLRAQAFVEAARALGAGPWRILWRHLLPNLIGPIAVYGTLVVPQAVLQESFLSFLGIGVQQPMPSLGRLAADGVQAVNTFVGFWWLITFPCGLLLLTLLALNFVGDGLRDAFDPKSRATMWV